jgi:hypothetical protein
MPLRGSAVNISSSVRSSPNATRIDGGFGPPSTCDTTAALAARPDFDDPLAFEDLGRQIRELAREGEAQFARLRGAEPARRPAIVPRD